MLAFDHVRKHVRFRAYLSNGRVNSEANWGSAKAKQCRKHFQNRSAFRLKRTSSSGTPRVRASESTNRACGPGCPMPCAADAYATHLAQQVQCSAVRHKEAPVQTCVGLQTQGEPWTAEGACVQARQVGVMVNSHGVGVLTAGFQVCAGQTCPSVRCSSNNSR